MLSLPQRIGNHHNNLDQLPGNDRVTNSSLLACRQRRQCVVLAWAIYIFAISKDIIQVICNFFSKINPEVISKAISIDKFVPLSPDAIDELDSAILDYFLEGRPAEPWGKATPSEVYRALDERGILSELGNPVRQTVQNRIQRLALSGHLDNKYDSGSYEFVSDPRDNASKN